MDKDRAAKNSSGEAERWTPDSEADHFARCPGCGAWADNLGQAFEHAGPLPHQKTDREQ
jgi:hypothetical protein